MMLILRILALVVLLFSRCYADIYKCKDPVTGEIIFTNLGIQGKLCKVYIKEPKKNYLNREIPSGYLKNRWFKEVGKAYSIDPALLKAIAKVESSFNPKAISPKGALGLMQLLPETAELVGVKNPLNPLENLKGAALYLKKLLDEFKDLPLALAAYNAGPEKVKAYRGIPPYPETRQFVRSVLYYYRLYRSY